MGSKMGKDIHKLRSICHRPLEEENFISVYCRKVSIHITKFLVNTPITPNQITIIGIILFLIGTLFLGIGRTYLSFLGILLMELAYLCCLVDGEIARYKKMTSWLGIYYERLGLYVKRSALLLGLTVNLYSHYERGIVFLLAIFGFVFIPINYLMLEDTIFRYRLLSGDFGDNNISEKKDNRIYKKKIFKDRKQGLLKDLKIMVCRLENVVHMLFIFVIFDVFLKGLFNFRFIDLMYIYYCIVFPILKSYFLFTPRNSERLEKRYQDFLEDIKNNSITPLWRIK